MVSKGESLPLLFPEEDLFTPYASTHLDTAGSESNTLVSGGRRLDRCSRVDLGSLGTVVPCGRFPHLWLQAHADVYSNRLRVMSSTELPALLSTDFTGRPADILVLLGEWASSDLQIISQAILVLISTRDSHRFNIEYRRPLRVKLEQLQRRFQRPYYSLNSADLVEMPPESRGLNLKRRKEKRCLREMKTRGKSKKGGACDVGAL